ncbi:predicted protein [Histoplasma mississippiense (nom. inval.)]|uniref:predicted protein n=1 Tax=Ajellomyces capsulatus (strain NAm1 / WU24) TaxID=2059318 RepID=UPI000157BD25|nr:predicted protein [Histoplasma mississippiense (nom. inval.)]EDN05920.1 predicted protein [Histoplasma mississippiense (nom. inval.)]
MALAVTRSRVLQIFSQFPHSLTTRCTSLERFSKGNALHGLGLPEPNVFFGGKSSQ